MKFFKNTLIITALLIASSVTAKQMGAKATAPVSIGGQPTKTIEQSTKLEQPVKREKTYKQFFDEIRAMKKEDVLTNNSMLTDKAVELTKNIYLSSLSNPEKSELLPALLWRHFNWTDDFKKDKELLMKIASDADNRMMSK